MSRFWITAQPSSVEVIMLINRTRLRRTYRLLRKSMPRYQARWVVRDLLNSGQSEFKL